MKGVIFSSLLFATATVAVPALAASISQPPVIADSKLEAVPMMDVEREDQHESLLQEAKRSQNESLQQRQMYQLQQLRQQAERDAARVKKLKRLKESS